MTDSTPNPMGDQRQEGKLAIEDASFQEEFAILWMVHEGVIADGNTWKASVSFTRDWTISQRIVHLVFRYLNSPTATMKLQISNGVWVQCMALFDDPEDISDFALWGGMPVGSLDFGRARIASDIDKLDD